MAGAMEELEAFLLEEAYAKEGFLLEEAYAKGPLPKLYAFASTCPICPSGSARSSFEAPRLSASPEAPRPSIGMPPAQMPEVVPPPPGMQTQSSRKKQRNAASAKTAMQAGAVATST